MLATLLDSDWLIRMLDKSSEQAAQKLLALFDILEDTLNSPLATHIQPASNLTTNQRLQSYLITQARLARAKLPDMLGNQVYFMAVSACQHKLNHPDSYALMHAKLAAKALIKEQTQREIHWPSIRNYAIALLMLGVGLWGGYRIRLSQQPTAMPVTSTVEIPPRPLSHEASPSETAAIYERLETMKHGDCRLIEALQLPERMKSIYIENIIQGHVTTNREEQIIVNQLLDQVQCNYTPKLMQNSK